MSLLRARGLRYGVGSVTIIDGIDVDVVTGELVGVIGPNGAGKTTLLRMLAGLLTPREGTVTLEGLDIHAMESRARARRVGFMSQETALSFPFTVMETLLMGRYPHLKRFQQETADDRERARRMLAYVGLSGLEDRAIGELSGGERQLVFFAKALVQDTETLVLDEPSASLDIRHQDRIFSMARELAGEGRAVITSVHNLGVAAQYCSRLVLLNKGRVAAEGRAEQVLQSQVLDQVYGIRTVVSPNAATGSLTVSVVPWRAAADGGRVHLIGGAGSAVNLTRELFRLGCALSGGIAHEYDSDEKLWRSLGIRCSVVGAFSWITDEDVEAAAPLVREADITILCSFPVGPGNLGNLKLAGLARNLLIMRTGPRDAPRGFVTAESKALFEELCSRGRLMLYEEVLAELEGPGGAPGHREDG